MTEKQDAVTAFGCLEFIWAVIGIAVNCGLNGTLWYMLLSHVEATPTMWAVFYVYLPVHCVVAIVTITIGLIKKAVSP